MMKKHDIFLSAVRLPLDFVIVFFTFFLAREIRLIDNFLLRPAKTITTDALFWFALFWALLFIFVFAIHWLYSMRNNTSKIWEYWQIIWYSFYCYILYLCMKWYNLWNRDPKTYCLSRFFDLNYFCYFWKNFFKWAWIFLD